MRVVWVQVPVLLEEVAALAVVGKLDRLLSTVAVIPPFVLGTISSIAPDIDAP